MSVLRRYHGTRSVAFITCNTYRRRPILIEYADIFWRAIEVAKRQASFELIAHVILPDHFHLIIDPGTSEFDNIIQRIKMSFGGKLRHVTRVRSGRIWQHRYWDHIIRDQVDMNRHIDYVHYNPVKHGHVESPWAWKHTSIHRYLAEGLYERDWGTKETMNFEGDFGE